MSIPQLNELPVALMAAQRLQQRPSRQGADFMDTLKPPIAADGAKQARTDGGVILGAAALTSAARAAPPTCAPLASDVPATRAPSSAVGLGEVVQRHLARGTTLQPRLLAEALAALAKRSPVDDLLAGTAADTSPCRGPMLRAPDGRDAMLVRLFPFGLVANRYLSEWIAVALTGSGTLGTTGATTLPTRSGDVLLTSLAASAQRPLGTAHPTTAALPSATITTFMPYAQEWGDAWVRPDASLPAIIAMTATNRESAAIPVRAMWTSPAPEGGWTLWLRDYRIDADQGAALADRLAREGDAMGRPLQHIYLNGRCVWSASNHQGA